MDDFTPEGGGPVRLRVNYKSPEALLQAFTQSVGKGGVDLPSKKKLKMGTRFHIQLLADDVDVPVEVFGEVVHATTQDDGAHVLTIRYDAGTDRAGLDANLRKLFDHHLKSDRVRMHARVPVNITATERKREGSPVYLVRDVSRGGIGVEIEQEKLPPHIRNGVPVFIRMWLNDGTLALHGEVAWTAEPPERNQFHATFGVKFGTLQKNTQTLLDRILVLYGMPNGPWRADLAFGMDAVGEMP